MQTVDKLLDAVKKQHAIKSDYKLAQFLELTQNTIANYRHGRSRPDDKTLARLADLGGVNPAEIDVLAAQLQAERATNEDARMMWKRIAQRLQAGAVHVAVLVAVSLVGFTSTPNAGAEVLPPAAGLNSQSVYYVKSRKFLKKVWGFLWDGIIPRFFQGKHHVQSAASDAAFFRFA